MWALLLNYKEFRCPDYFLGVGRGRIGKKSLNADEVGQDRTDKTQPVC